MVILWVYPMGLSYGFILWVYPMGLSNIMQRSNSRMVILWVYPMGLAEK
jgi:hypothetical protein